jgi:[heparan sulfate]-glucosamine 3-sulfotransferase 5
MSDYALQYQMLTAVFPRKNIFVVNGEKIVQNPLDEIRKVETFLGLPPFFREQHFISRDEKGKFPCFKLGWKTNCMEGDKGREHPILQNKTYDFLEKIFIPGLEKFEQETGVKFVM